MDSRKGSQLLFPLPESVDLPDAAEMIHVAGAGSSTSYYLRFAVRRTVVDLPRTSFEIDRISFDVINFHQQS